ADRACFSRAAFTLRFGGINRPALAGIDWLAVLRSSPLSLPLEFLLSTKAQIGFVLPDQSLSMFAINRQPVRLTIRAKCAADVWAFIPIEAEPLQVVNELAFEAGFAAIEVGVLDAQHHRPALLPCKQPIEERGPGVADME